MSNYPNLELLEYRARLYLKDDTDFLLKVSRVPQNPHVKPSPNFQVICFPQVWGSTALGFDGEMGGQAITTAYTTIVKETLTETYIVFFGNRVAYKVDNPTDIFYKDLCERNLKSVNQARNFY